MLVFIFLILWVWIIKMYTMTLFVFSAHRPPYSKQQQQLCVFIDINLAHYYQMCNSWGFYVMSLAFNWRWMGRLTYLTYIVYWHMYYISKNVRSSTIDKKKKKKYAASQHHIDFLNQFVFIIWVMDSRFILHTIAEIHITYHSCSTGNILPVSIVWPDT